MTGDDQGTFHSDDLETFLDDVDNSSMRGTGEPPAPACFPRPGFGNCQDGTSQVRSDGTPNRLLHLARDLTCVSIGSWFERNGRPSRYSTSRSSRILWNWIVILGPTTSGFYGKCIPYRVSRTKFEIPLREQWRPPRCTRSMHQRPPFSSPSRRTWHLFPPSL